MASLTSRLLILLFANVDNSTVTVESVPVTSTSVFALFEENVHLHFIEQTSQYIIDMLLWCTFRYVPLLLKSKCLFQCHRIPHYHHSLVDSREKETRWYKLFHPNGTLFLTIQQVNVVSSDEVFKVNISDDQIASCLFYESKWCFGTSNDWNSYGKVNEKYMLWNNNEINNKPFPWMTTLVLPQML